MWKLLIVTYVAANVQGGPIGEIVHPYDFADQQTCEEFKAADWKVRFNKNLIVHDAQCVKAAERI